MSNDDKRERCEHGVVFPMEYCAPCLKRELAEATADRDACAEDARSKDERIARLVAARPSSVTPKPTAWMWLSGHGDHEENILITASSFLAERWKKEGAELVPLYEHPAPLSHTAPPGEANEIIEWCIRVLAKHYRDSRFDPEESRLVLSKAVGELRRALPPDQRVA